jgi:hypothetical protein
MGGVGLHLLFIHHHVCHVQDVHYDPVGDKHPAWRGTNILCLGGEQNVTDN